MCPRVERLVIRVIAAQVINLVTASPLATSL